MSGARTIVVTGASGFIARNAIPPLICAGHRVIAINRSGSPPDDPLLARAEWNGCDLMDGDATARLFASVRADTLLHAAWDVSPGYWTSPGNIDWLEASLRIARQFRREGGRRIVSAGTCAEYDWTTGAVRLDEFQSPFAPATLYAKAKRALHTSLAGWGTETDTSVAWGLLFFSFGPNEHRSRLLPDVALALLRSEAPRTTLGTQVRDFMDVRDAGAALAALTLCKVEGPVNIGTGRGVTIADFVDMIARNISVRARIDRGALPMRPGDPPHLVAATHRLVEEVGFEPSHSLEDGVRNALEWWRLGVARPDGDRLGTSS